MKRKLTKLIYGFKNLRFDERVERLGINDLQTKRLRGDLIECYKNSKGLDKMNRKIFKNDEISHCHNLRRHRCKLKKEKTKNTRPYSFFLNRISGT